MRLFFKKASTNRNMSFWDHVAELRRRLIYCFVTLTATSFVGVLVYDWLLRNVFLPPYCRVLIKEGFDRPCNPCDPRSTRWLQNTNQGFYLCRIGIGDAYSLMESMAIHNSGVATAREKTHSAIHDKRPNIVQRGRISRIQHL